MFKAEKRNVAIKFSIFETFKAQNFSLRRQFWTKFAQKFG